MEHIVLGLLMLKSMTIYELNSNFCKGLTMIYAASYGNLQYAVKKLLEKNMIYFKEAVENSRNKKIYYINPKGVENFYEWMRQDVSSKNIESLMLAKLYFLGLVKETAQKELIIDNLAQAVREYLAELQAVKQTNSLADVPRAFQDIAKYQLFTIDYGIGVCEYANRWLDDARKL